MNDLINCVKPYDIKSINTISKSLIFYKNILRLISKKGCEDFNVKYIYPLRWSNQKNEFVIDFRTQKSRDINGICLRTLINYYSQETQDYKEMFSLLNIFNSSKEDKFWKDINLKKNEAKFIAISMSNDLKFSVMGIYNFCEYKNRIGSYSHENNRSILIDNSIQTKKDITKILNSRSVGLKDPLIIKCYLDKFTFFKNSILNKKIVFYKEESEVEISLYDYLSEEFKYDYKKRKCKEIVINKSIDNISKDIDNILQYILYKEFNNYLKSILKYKNSIIVYDKDIRKNIIIGDLSLSQSIKIIKKEEKTNINILPGVF